MAGHVEDRGLWAEYIREARMRAGRSQRDLSADADRWLEDRYPEGVPEGMRISQKEVSNYERGSRPEPGKLATLVGTLNLDPVETAVAYAGFDRDWLEARTEATREHSDELGRLLAARPTAIESRHLADFLEILRFWQADLDNPGRLDARRRDRRLRAV